MTDLFGETESGAMMSLCGKYRYSLFRVWDRTLPEVVFVMLNPSTADHRDDDPTITRCLGFARRAGFGTIIVVNLFAWRATDPDELLTVSDPVGPDNDDTIQRTIAGRQVIAAWGGISKKHYPREKAVIQMLRQNRGSVPPFAEVKCLGTTAKGFPRHPLFVASATELEVFQIGR